MSIYATNRPIRETDTRTYTCNRCGITAGYGGGNKPPAMCADCQYVLRATTETHGTTAGYVRTQAQERRGPAPNTLNTATPAETNARTTHQRNQRAAKKGAQTK